MDGWGIGPPWGGNAIVQARTPNMDLWWRTYSHTSLLASGEAVGLPAGTFGNSETGHLNIGAGRIVPQDLGFINKTISDGSFFKNQQILQAFDHAKKNNGQIHFMGLAGIGHVHSDLSHLYALLKMAKQNKVSEVYLDLFTDGRDSDPESALVIFDKIQKQIKSIGIGKINSICGRYFAMDRDKNWGRTSRAYNALTKGEAEVGKSCRDIISKSYLKNITDEFILPHLISDSAKIDLICNNDSVILFNFRPDRVKQISQAFSSEMIPEMSDRKILKNLYFCTFVNRDPHPIGVVAFKPEEIKNCLAEVVSKNNLHQLHIAETEKYAHVTYFIDGGREKPFLGEDRVVIPSPKVKTYDLAPAMSSAKITDSIVADSGKGYNLIICNYANADMVGHAGNFYAAVQAVEAVDFCLGRLIKNLLIQNYTIFITADHGNAEEMINPRTNQPDTEHTGNPVPLVIISKELQFARAKLLNGGALANVAPTILEVMEIPKPPEMTARSLIGN